MTKCFFYFWKSGKTLKVVRGLYVLTQFPVSSFKSEEYTESTYFKLLK